MRFSTHIAGCEARLFVIIDNVQRETVLLDTLIKPGSKSLITANSSTQSRAGLVGAHYLPVLKEVPMNAKGPFQSGVIGLGSIP